MKNLIDALEKFISLVNPEDTYFMSKYKLCIIGKTVGWNTDFKSINKIECDALKTHFGILVNSKMNNSYFSHRASSLYSEIEWKVIRLFTSAIYDDAFSYFGDTDGRIYNYRKYIRGKDWLKIANEVLAELKEQNV